MKSREKQLLDKFLNNTCTEEELDELLNYLDRYGDPEDLPDVEQIVLQLRNIPRISSSNSEKIFRTIMSTPNYQSSTQQLWHRGWLKMAAVLTGLIIISFAAYLWHDGHDQLEYLTDYGEIKTFVLPDGSEATLNANSTLHLPEHWSDGQEREVWLEGEAFFSVRHTSSNQKFIVHTSDKFSIQVLGTKFNVLDRREKTSVVLSSGKVKVVANKGAGQREHMMKPGDRVEYQENTEELIQNEVDIRLYTSWKDNLMMFEHESLHNVAERISDHFGYHVYFETKSISELHFTGSSPADDLDLLLKTLSKSFNLNITKTEHQIMIKELK